ncbi:peptidoglycan recognition protein family protein [Candidatus Micrarchaeota archaeon]|jgi:hypothetical protein|nr:peptidoglycan recognition protein family protein [Candidatus Micrarchaeota archaeon]
MKQFSVYLDDLHAIYILDPKNKFNFQFFQDKPKEIYIHHTGNNSHSLEEAYNIGISRFNQPSYHFIIDRKGSIYQTLPINVAGAHVRRHNENSFGIALLDLISPSSPTLAMKYSLGALIDFLKSNYPIEKVSTHVEATVSDVNEIIEQTRIKQDLPLLDINEIGELTLSNVEKYKENVKKEIKYSDVDKIVKDLLNQRVEYVKNCPGPYFKDLLDL